MAVRRLGVSEVRRRLPELVEAIARDGGRVDVTRRGESRVSIVRTADLERTPRGSRRDPAGLRVEFDFPSERLIDLIRDLRAEWPVPRTLAALPDPSDRFITGTALRLKVPLLTGDRRIAASRRVPVIWD